MSGGVVGRGATDRAAHPRWFLLLAMSALLPVLGGWNLLRRRSAAVEAGNARMKAGKADEALVEYDKAIAELPTDPGAHFDRGVALSALSRFDESAQEFLRATEAKETPLRSEAFYNLGNAFFKKDKFKESFAAYQRALELDPKNERAKWNAELALKKQREDDKKKQDQKKDDDKQDKKQDDKKDQKDQKDKSDPKDDNKRKDDDKGKGKGKDDKQDEKPKSPESKPKPEQDPPKPPEAAPSPPPERKPSGEKSAEEREMESALDGLDKSPKELEKQRALLRAVRRAPPTRDW